MIRETSLKFKQANLKILRQTCVYSLHTAQNQVLRLIRLCTFFLWISLCIRTIYRPPMQRCTSEVNEKWKLGEMHKSCCCRHIYCTGWSERTLCQSLETCLDCGCWSIAICAVSLVSFFRTMPVRIGSTRLLRSLAEAANLSGCQEEQLVR